VNIIPLKKALARHRAEGYTGFLPSSYRLLVTINGADARHCASILRAAAVHTKDASERRALDETWRRLAALDDGEQQVTFASGDGIHTIAALTDYITKYPSSPFTNSCFSVAKALGSTFSKQELKPC
jgi:hypothetical protein